jgi:protein-tyrosine phosphatase
MHSILFVCTGNQFRSPIAAEVFREQLTRDGRDAGWQVFSAGTWTSTGQRPFPLAVNLAASFGLNLEGHVTRALDQAILDAADVVLVMEAGHKESIHVEFPSARGKTYLLSEAIEGSAYDIPDPAGSPGEALGIIRELVELIRRGAGQIYRLVGE